ncbi:MAG: hypothetical protein GY749_21210 [Desulfobacteraceae bacterium]|nr:hypothetical protein [Desulfobacteraceae bacterium]
MLKQQRAISIPEDTVKVILKIIQQANEPIAAEKIQQQLPGPFRIDNAELLNRILNEQAKTGNIHRWLLFNSKKRFWVHEPQEYIKSKILEIIQQANEPLTAEKIQQRLSAPFRINIKLLKKILNDQVRIKTICKWNPKGSENKFWNQSLENYALRKIGDMLSNSDKGLTRSEMKKALKKSIFGYSVNMAEELVRKSLHNFLKEKKFFEHPPVDGRETARIRISPLNPANYFKKMKKEIEAVYKKLEKAGTPQDEIFQAMNEAFMPQPEKPSQYQDIYKIILDKIVEIDPAARQQAPISIPKLRNSLDLSKKIFDQSIIGLCTQGKVFLNKHAHPVQMNEEEREQMVADGQGNYYVVIVLRKGTENV